jgi:hypothetical protein
MGKTDLGGEIIAAVEGVTKAWARQRRGEERDRSAALRRREALVRSHRVTVKEAAYELMAAAYLKASSGGTLPAHARQIMYAARGEVQRLTGRTLDDKYFCQQLLPDYLAEHPEGTKSWDVVFDARGHFQEPHTDQIVPLGTIDVRNYLGSIGPAPPPDLTVTVAGGTFPTRGPRHRFGAILFVEKEGFLPLFKAVHLAERFDLAIMSTKGMSVTASRLLVERLCSEHGVPLLVLHDFDKSGFSIVGTLRRDTRRYTFTQEIEVIDLGLRLADVERWALESEEVNYGKADPADNLRRNGATAQEIEFLCHGGNEWQGYHGRRVELNAFASADLVTWIEGGLAEHGIKKVVPDKDTLATAYRRAVEIKLLKERTADLAQAVHAEAEKTRVPKALADAVRRHLGARPQLSWQEAVIIVVHKGMSE